MKEFKHIQSAHCENGVTSSLFYNNGFEEITEPLAFGIGSGLFYIHLPFIKINNGPAISFRSVPGTVFKRNCKNLGIGVYQKTFSSPQKAQLALDTELAKNSWVGCQVGVYHLPYFPLQYRFHFNAHNLIVFGKQGNQYQVSDPVMEETTLISEEDLSRVRFAKGALAPKGRLYYPIIEKNPTNEQISNAILKGIKRNARDMLYIPSRLTGVRGIGYTANKIKSWRNKLGPRRAGLYLGQIIRMQEEIGTGGGGFRYIYAAFLEQSHSYLQNDKISLVSEDFTKSGDSWRNCAVAMASIMKGKNTEQKDFDEVAERMFQIKEIEKEAFLKLRNLVK
ncbi:MAG: BtrH N-terminal domain-containing protein [Flavobacteriia bacterium]|nr:BtrH N-terminal domain-containing protein [Flavobacteriia bacterium]